MGTDSKQSDFKNRIILNIGNWDEYQCEIGHVELLAREEEIELAGQIHNGDNEAMEKQE